MFLLKWLKRIITKSFCPPPVYRHDINGQSWYEYSDHGYHNHICHHYSHDGEQVHQNHHSHHKCDNPDRTGHHELAFEKWTHSSTEDCCEITDKDKPWQLMETKLCRIQYAICLAHTNVYKDTTCTLTQYMDTCALKCDPLTGSDNVHTCTENGTWKCDRIFKNNI